jgi:hypothetical protein
MRISIILSAILLVTACRQKSTLYSNLPRITVSDSLIKEKVKISDVILDAELIPLETTSNSSISEIYKIVEWNNIYIMEDKYVASAVMSFDHQGKFVNRYGFKGKESGNYVLPMDFFVDSSNHELIVINSESHKLNYYDLATGSYKRDLKYNFPTHNLLKFQEGYVFSGAARDQRIIYTDLNLQRKHSQISYNGRNGGGILNTFSKINDTLTLFRLSFNDTLYRVTETNTFPYMVIDFGEKRISDEFVESLTDPQKKRLQDYTISKMGNISTYLENNDTRIFVFDYKKKSFLFIQDKISMHKLVLQMDDINDDVFFLSKFPTLVGVDDDGYFLFSVSASKIFKAQKNMEMRNQKDSLITTAVKHINQLSNPVMGRVKFKKF